MPPILVPLDVELLGMKPCSFSEMLHIVKELEYMAAWFPNLKNALLDLLVAKLSYNRICSTNVGNNNQAC
jgi:hypothetical protein